MYRVPLSHFMYKQKNAAHSSPNIKPNTKLSDKNHVYENNPWPLLQIA